MPDPETVIRAELGPTEQLLWVGPARTGILLRPADAFLILFGLLWCGAVITGLVTMLAQGGPDMWVPGGMLSAFLLFGLYFVGGRLLVDARRRSRTAYGVSSERVIIVSGLSSRVVRSVNLDTLTDIILIERPSGSGTIIFGPLPPFWGWYAGQEWPGAGWLSVPQFEVSSEAHRVYEVILGARRSLKQV